MPIHTGSDERGHFVRYGHTGKKYYFSPNSTKSFNRAHNLALKQMAAIMYRGYREHQLF
jgi:hypothetical protein